MCAKPGIIGYKSGIMALLETPVESDWSRPSLVADCWEVKTYCKETACLPRSFMCGLKGHNKTPKKCQHDMHPNYVPLIASNSR